MAPKRQNITYDAGWHGASNPIMIQEEQLGPPVERLEQGTRFFAVVYFSRGTLSPKKGKRALLGDLDKMPLGEFYVDLLPLTPLAALQAQLHFPTTQTCQGSPVARLRIRPPVARARFFSSTVRVFGWEPEAQGILTYGWLGMERKENILGTKRMYMLCIEQNIMFSFAATVNKAISENTRNYGKETGG